MSRSVPPPPFSPLCFNTGKYWTLLLTTGLQILDFGAVRDGQAPEELGRRILLNEAEVRAMIEEEV